MGKYLLGDKSLCNIEGKHSFHYVQNKLPELQIKWENKDTRYNIYICKLFIAI